LLIKAKISKRDPLVRERTAPKSPNFTGFAVRRPANVVQSALVPCPMRCARNGGSWQWHFHCETAAWSGFDPGGRRKAGIAKKSHVDAFHYIQRQNFQHPIHAALQKNPCSIQYFERIASDTGPG